MKAARTVCDALSTFWATQVLTGRLYLLKIKKGLTVTTVIQTTVQAKNYQNSIH